MCGEVASGPGIGQEREACPLVGFPFWGRAGRGDTATGRGAARRVLSRCHALARVLLLQGARRPVGAAVSSRRERRRREAVTRPVSQSCEAAELGRVRSRLHARCRGAPLEGSGREKRGGGAGRVTGRPEGGVVGGSDP